MSEVVEEQIEVEFLGTDQKKDSRKLPPGGLTLAENVVFQKTGRINKRRGYSRIGVVEDVNGIPIQPGNVFVNVGTRADELVLFGIEWLYAVTSRTSAMDNDTAIVRRGPIARVSVRAQAIAVASLTENI